MSDSFGNQIELTGARDIWFWRIVSWAGNTVAVGREEYTSPYEALEHFRVNRTHILHDECRNNTHRS
jgi:hypothetical protein